MIHGSYSRLITGIVRSAVFTVVGLATGLGLAGCTGARGPVSSSTLPEEAGMDVPIATITEGVLRRTLPNGLTVLVKPIEDAPAVAVVTWVKTGYFHEPDELAGISHVLEHMYFNGTPSRPGPEDIGRETRGYGGQLNAGTIYDHTSYYVVLPRERWREGLAIQADAFQHPLFDEAVLSKEMEAILQEARRKLDDPGAFAREKMYELAFQKHRMRRWRIGTEEVLRSIDREDLVRWHEDHYRPSNTVLCVVGGVEPETVLAEIEALYGAQPEGHLRQEGGPAEPRQEGFRYRRLEADIARNYVYVGFHTPGEGHRDVPALDLLSTILGTGRSSRLVSRLKEQDGTVTSISASNYEFDDVGMLEISAICDIDHLDRTSRDIFVELERMKLFGPTEAELERARTILLTGEAFAQEEVLGQANLLAAYEARGDYRDYDRERKALARVTVEDVQRVAREYLQLDNASLLEYCPLFAIEGRAPEVMREHISGAVLAAVRQMEEPSLPERGRGFLPSAQREAWVERFAQPEAVGHGRHRFELPGGGVLLVEENPTAPTVSAGIWFRGGRVAEYANISGLTTLLQRVMVKQTKNRLAPQLAAEIEALGTTIDRPISDDWFGFTTASLAASFPLAFDVLFDVVSSPYITPAQLEREVDAHLAAILGIEDRAGALAVQLLREALYPEHPYGLPELGNPTVLRLTNPQRLERHYAETVRPEAMVIAISGDVDAATVHEFVLQYTERWHPEGKPLPATAAEFYSHERLDNIPALMTERVATREKDKAQTALLIAYPTVPRGSEDIYPLDVLQSITGGMGGTFFERIRSQRGLAYQVSTFDSSKMLAGMFGTFVACSPDSAETVEAMVIELCRELALDPPTEEQIEWAKNSITGSYQVARQRNRARAGLMAAHELAGEPLEDIERYPERIRAVTRDDLKRVAETWFLDRPYAEGKVQGRSGSDANPH